MLRLKYLFDNVNLAEMILRNWHFDEGSKEMFKYYRISSNAIYPFKRKGETRLLRFAPQSEKLKSNLLAELEFISYLRDNQYGVLESVASKRGEELIEVRTPRGEYYASVFKRVSGVQINHTDYSDTILFSHGRALGRLHYLSSHYTPGKYKRWSYSDVLDWIEGVLTGFPEESAAWMETALLRDYFASLPKSQSSYGLIHYDFEYDNVFYDDTTGSCNVIDFDDAMYHWYAMDIEQALHSLRDCVSSEIFHHKKQCFLNGYRTEFDVSGELESVLPASRRFANLYGYARLLRSVEEKWENEPDWLTNLRKKLTKAMEEDSASFGREL